MKNMWALLGRPVLMNGKTIGHVTGIELDERLKSVVALYIDGGLYGTRRIGRDSIKLLGDVSVLVTEVGKRGRPKEAKLRRARLSDGSRVGAVTGALIDEETLEIKALELTRGYLDDWLSGRQWISRYAVNMTSGDVLIESEGGDI